jgi:hypothetical protein
VKIARRRSESISPGAPTFLRIVAAFRLGTGGDMLGLGQKTIDLKQTFFVQPNPPVRVKRFGAFGFLTGTVCHAVGHARARINPPLPFK